MIDAECIVITSVLCNTEQQELLGSLRLAVEILVGMLDGFAVVGLSVALWE